MGGTKTVRRGLAAISLVVALFIGASATPASAALVAKGTLHVEYTAVGKFRQTEKATELPGDSTAELSWKVSSDIPLAAASTVPYRYSKRSPTGTITASANFTRGTIECKGALSVSDANGVENVGHFEFDFGKKGQTLTNQGTLKGTSPVPVSTGFVGQFTDANGTGCSGYQPIVPIGGSPGDPGGTVLLKVDLDKLNKSKSKTYPVGLTKTYDDAGHKTDVDWTGTVVVTLKK